MHYKNGREAKVLDPVIVKEYGGYRAGVIHSLNPGTTSCNAQVAWPGITGIQNTCITVGDCYHAEDAFAALSKARPIPEELAGLIYSIYCEEVGGKAFNGDPLPDWKTFSADPAKEKQSKAWIKAAAVALAAT